MGDWDWRGIEVDTVFATVRFDHDKLGPDCIDAINRTQAQFHPSYPGWAFYLKVIRGETLFDRTLRAYAVTMARALSRARKRNGRAVVSRAARGPWIARAGMDALYRFVNGSFPAGVHATIAQLGADAPAPNTYSEMRQTLARAMIDGAGHWRAVLHGEMGKILNQRKYGFDFDLEF